LIAEIDDELRKLIPLTGYKLHTMPGIDLVTEAQIISEIGDINRFPTQTSWLGLWLGTGAIQLCRKGQRPKVQEWQQGTKCDISLSCNPDGSSIDLRKAKTPVFREYFEQKVKEGKNKPQALVCVARRLVRIIYGMMKTRTEYRPYEKTDDKN